jgi:hypothetical protein
MQSTGKVHRAIAPNDGMISEDGTGKDRGLLYAVVPNSREGPREN